MSAFSRPSVLIALVYSFLLIAISTRAEIPVSITYQDAAGSGFYDNSPRTAVTGNSGTTLGEQRRNAFEAAVYHWSKLLNGTVTLRVRAIWVSQGTSTLASASPLTFASDWNGVPVAGRYYPGALANQLAGLDHDPNNDDIQVVCNSDWDSGVNSGKGDPRKWYYGTDGAPGGSDFDFYSVVIHELGHGFGFGSFLNTDGTWQNGMPTIYDHFLSNSSGSWVRNLTQSQRAAVITSGNLFSAGSTTTSVNYDQWAKIYAPATYTAGSSLSHLDESTYSSVGSIDECMTPIASFPTHNIGPVATALLRDMGYNFVDNQAPSVAITLPANGSSRSGLSIAVGTAIDNSSTGDAGATGLREIRISLFRQAGGNWFNWSANTWGSTTFDWNTHVKKADASIVPIGKGTRTWAITLPTLADGVYEIQAQSVDQMNLGSAWVKSTFTIDRSAPSISFDPLHTNSVVFNFSQLGGLVNEATTVSYAISDVTDSPARFWNGSSWVTSGIVYLPGTISAGRWAPANTAQLPSRAQIRLGNYVLYAKAFDAASNSITASIPVTRSASDSTPPDVVISSPTNNQVLIARTLPALTGTANDSESGIGNISLYLMRLAESGFLYWNGSTWSETVSTISANYDSASGVWQANGTLPTGNDLPNGNYQLQVSAQNQENPPGTRGVSAVFVVDYHPVYTWTGGGANDNFANPANWSPIAVPPSDALVVINAGTCDASAMGSLSIWGVNIGGSGTFTTPGLFVKKLNLSAGTLNGGAINIDGDNGVFNWTGGQFKGTLGILAGAVGNISGNATKTLASGAVLNNSGTINWSGAGDVYNFGYALSDRATINNYGAFNVLNDGRVFSSSYNASIFNNFAGAVFNKTGGSGTNWVNDFVFNNSGELRAETGTLGFNTAWSVAGGSEFNGNGNFLFQSGTLTIGGGVVLDRARLTMQSGTLIGAADFVLTTLNGGSFEWTGGGITGTLEIAPNTTFNISGHSEKSIGGATLIRNRGNVTWSGTGNINNFAYVLADRATIRNMSGATWSILGSANFTYNYNASTFNNESGAVIQKTAGNTTGFDWVFNNDGAVECSSGTLLFNSGGSSGGSFLANPGTVIRFGNGNQTLNNGTQLVGAGKFEIQTGTVTRNGNLQLGAGATIATVDLISGTFAGNGALTGNAVLNWTGGAIDGQLDLGTNIVVNVSSSSEKSIGGASVINNGGIFNWGGSGNLNTYAYELANRATFNNLSNAVFTITSNATFSVIYNASIFNNLPGAKVIKADGAGTTRFDWVFNSLGTVRCASGSLVFGAGGDSGGAFTAETNSIIRFAGGTHTLTNNTILDGAGKIQITTGAVTHNGNIQTGTSEVPATLEISGGAFNGSGALNGICTVNWTGGMIGGGRLDATPGIVFNVSGSSEKNFGGATVFNNAGVFNWAGTGRINCYAYEITNRSVFNNLSNAVFNIQDDGAVFSVIYNASIFTNHTGGLLLKSGGAGTNSLDSFVYVNAGEVRVETGTLLFNSKLDLNPGSIFSGAGIVRLKGENTLATALQSRSHIVFESGSFTGLTNANPTPSISGIGGFEWTGGTIGGALTINSGVTFDVNGPSEKPLAQKTVWNNYGIVNWNGAGNLNNYAYDPADVATIYNRSGAIWNLTSDADFSYTYNASKFYNEGGATFRKSSGTGVTSCGWDFNNAGSLEIFNGIFAFDGASAISPGGSTTLSLGGVAAGTGYSQLTRSGQIAFNGNLQIVLTNGFVPTNGTRFNLVTYTSRTGQFSSVALPQLPFGSIWKLNYGATTLTAEVVPPTNLENVAKLANNQFQFNVTGQPAARAIVETSTNLVQWVPVATNEPFAGNWTFSDSFQASSATRFYRVIIVE